MTWQWEELEHLQTMQTTILFCYISKICLGWQRECLHIHGLAQDGNNSNVLAMELLQSCT